jgi:hypothetical protein
MIAAVDRDDDAAGRPLPAGWRFVQGGTRQLELSEGDWIRVKRRLTAGESRAAMARMYTVTGDGSRVFNYEMVGLSTILAYLIEWNVTDASGRIAPLTGPNGDDPLVFAAATLDQLDPESYDEILQAVKQHERDMIAERVAEKKTRRGALTSSATSSSPDTITGPTSTSGSSTLMSTP